VGEAKRRGTFEERRTAAIERDRRAREARAEARARAAARAKAAAARESVALLMVRLALGALAGRPEPPSAVDLSDAEARRGLVRGVTCNHKRGPEVDELGAAYYVCDKNGRECLVDGRCPSINETEEEERWE
jgi:hypothetical protein